MTDTLVPRSSAAVPCATCHVLVRDRASYSPRPCHRTVHGHSEPLPELPPLRNVSQNSGVGHPAINLDAFTPQEQLDLLEQIWTSLSQHPEDIPLTPAQAAELDRRLDDLDSDIQADRPLGEPWEEVRKRLNSSR